MILHMDFMELVSLVIVIVGVIVGFICCIRYERKKTKQEESEADDTGRSC